MAKIDTIMPIIDFSTRNHKLKRENYKEDPYCDAYALHYR